MVSFASIFRKAFLNIKMILFYILINMDTNVVDHRHTLGKLEFPEFGSHTVLIGEKD